jgi:hypothetical protein
VASLVLRFTVVMSFRGADALLVALQGASISFGMPGMQPMSFSLPAGISCSTVIDVLFGLFGQWIAMWKTGHVPRMPANGHWLEVELPAFIQAHWKHLDIQNSYPSYFRTLNQRFLTLEQKPFDVKSHHFVRHFLSNRSAEGPND